MNLRNFPSLPNPPNLPNLEKLPNLANLPHLPDLSNLQRLSSLAGLPDQQDQIGFENINNTQLHDINELSSFSVYAIFYGIIFGVCIIANPVTFFAILTQKTLRSPTNVFLAALSAVDFFVGVFCVTQNGVHLAILMKGKWPFGELACKLYIYCLHMLPSVSAGLLVLLSIERLLAVKYPMLAEKVLRYSVTIPAAVLVWVIAAATNTPFFYYGHYKVFPDNIPACYPIDTGRVYKTALLSNTVIWFIIPCTFLAIANSWSAKTICASTREGTVVRSSSNAQSYRGNRRIQKRYCCLPCFGRASVRRRSGQNDTIEERRRIGWIQIGIVIAFIILHAPRRLYLIYRGFLEQGEIRDLNTWIVRVHPLTFLMQFAVSAVNPIIYGFISRMFRQGITHMFSCRKDRDMRRARVNQNAFRLTSRQESLSQAQARHQLLVEARERHISRNSERTYSSSQMLQELQDPTNV